MTAAPVDTRTYGGAAEAGGYGAPVETRRLRSAASQQSETPPAAPIIVPATAGPQTPGTGVVSVSDIPRSDGQWLSHRNLSLDIDSRIVIIDGDEVDLTRTEFDLLAALLESRRRVRSKADLTLLLRGESYVTTYFVGDADKRAVEAHMTNLRRKIGDNANDPRYIETVRGVGYRLTP